MKKTAVIGGGVAGLSAAHYLQDRRQVTLIESGARLGGHANPYLVTEGDRQFHLDTGFIIFNRGSYPNFLRFLGHLGVEAQARATDMSFMISNPAQGFEMSSRFPKGLLLNRKNAFRPAYYRLLGEILAFRTQAYQDMTERPNALETALGDYVAAYSQDFRENFILPFAAVIWSLPRSEMWKYPARAFVQFMYNHGHLKGFHGKRWMAFSASSRQYLQAFAESFKGEVRLGAPVLRVSQEEQGMRVRFTDGSTEYFDEVVMATHADQTYAMLERPTSMQERLLGPWRYSHAPATLHTHAEMVGGKRAHWGCWNVSPGADGDSYVMSYWLNHIHGIQARKNYFLTLNAGDVPADQVLARFNYSHPIFDQAAYERQKAMPLLNYQGRLFFCGSYFGHGFHEDAVSSSLKAVGALLGREAEAVPGLEAAL